MSILRTRVKVKVEITTRQHLSWSFVLLLFFFIFILILWGLFLFFVWWTANVKLDNILWKARIEDKTLLYSLLRVVNSEETGLLQVRLSAEYGRWLVWSVKGLKGKRYRFWRPIIGKRTRGLLTHCQTPYQLQFGIRLQQNHIDITSMADSAHLYVFYWFSTII